MRQFRNQSIRVKRTGRMVRCARQQKTDELLSPDTTAITLWVEFRAAKMMK